MPCRNLQDEVFTAVPFQVVPSSLDMFDYNAPGGVTVRRSRVVEPTWKLEKTTRSHGHRFHPRPVGLIANHEVRYALDALRFELLGKRIAVLVRGYLYTELLTSNMTSRSPSEGFPVKFQERPIKANTVGETASSIVITEAQLHDCRTCEERR
ncbi:hypothetical protein E4U09_006459 [Claviceps aff. purpurea]|uniref:Uncharacterized protein n=1 Tax=Claviceps aff. purpurea TaxID=1967640 RepID=A0A9P7QAZ1_9HYPO|nr:hypothetical protein E4U09_006459 [Claviceps aff. purpurea]